MYPLPDDARLFRRRLPSRRAGFLLAAIAAIILTVPMLAQAGPGLAPWATPNGCQPVGKKQVECSIAISFNAVEGATYYTATLTTPGGAVIPYGQIPTQGSGRLWSSVSHRYAGDGTYTVSITAYGVRPNAEPDEVTSEDAGADVGGDPS